MSSIISASSGSTFERELANEVITSLRGHIKDLNRDKTLLDTALQRIALIYRTPMHNSSSTHPTFILRQDVTASLADMLSKNPDNAVAKYIKTSLQKKYPEMHGIVESKLQSRQLA